MKKIAAVMLAVLIAGAVRIAGNQLADQHYVDGDGMERNPSAIMTVVPENSGHDELGNSVGYGTGEKATHKIYGGGEVWEGYDDNFVVYPGEETKEGLMGYSFTIKSLNEDGVTLEIGGEERIVSYGEKFYVSSLLMAMDGPSTSYTITFEKYE